MQSLLLTLPNNKILYWSKLKAFADNIINVAEKFKFVLRRVENIVGKEKMLVTTMFPKGLLYRVVKSRDCVVKSYRP